MAFSGLTAYCYIGESKELPASGFPHMDDVFQYGERILLCQEPERSYLIRLEPGGRFSSHYGNYEHDQMVGKRPGQWIRSHRGRPMLMLRPSTADLMMKVKRQTNIIYPKDAAQLMLKCGVVPGSRVLEVGTGSGSLTIALALAVGETGRIYTYDLREDLQKRGRKNVEAAGLDGRVEFALRAPSEPFGQDELDVAVLDVPTPWLEAEAVGKALKLGGRLASLNPTYNQIEQAAVGLEASGLFTFVEAEEILWRRILARAGRTRPEQRMIGHTEFLLYAVRAEPIPTEPMAAAAEVTIPTTVEEILEPESVGAPAPIEESEDDIPAADGVVGATDLDEAEDEEEIEEIEVSASELRPLGPAKAIVKPAEAVAVTDTPADPTTRLEKPPELDSAESDAAEKAPTIRHPASEKGHD